jgi:hypothetical protein
MSVKIGLFAVKNEHKSKILESDSFKGLLDREEIFKQVESEDGDLLILYTSRSFTPPIELHRICDDYLWLLIDDCGSLKHDGQWLDLPFSLQFGNGMGFVLKHQSKEQMAELNKYYNGGIVEDKRLIELYELQQSSGELPAELESEAEQILCKNGLEHLDLDDIFDENSVFNFINEFCLENSTSTDSMFILSTQLYIDIMETNVKKWESAIGELIENLSDTKNADGDWVSDEDYASNVNGEIIGSDLLEEAQNLCDNSCNNVYEPATMYIDIEGVVYRGGMELEWVDKEIF